MVKNNKKMKFIYVTVAEFLENGGKLGYLRDIFEPNEFGYGYDLANKSPMGITVEEQGGFYVKVEVKPIYK